MKQILIGIVIGISLMGLLSFSSDENFFTVKPASPRAVIIKSFEGEHVSKRMETFSQSYIQNGYIVKTSNLSINSSVYGSGFIVLERY